MAFNLTVTDHVLLEWAGDPTPEAFRSALMQITTHSAFRNGMPVVSVDFCSSYNPPCGEIRNLAAELGFHRPLLGRVALVVNSMLHYGLGNMLRVYAQSKGVEVGVFRQVDDALAWVRGEAGGPPLLTMQANG